MKRTRIGKLFHRTLAGAAFLAAAGTQSIGAPVQQAMPEGIRPIVVERDAGLPNSGNNIPQFFRDQQVFDAEAPRPMHPPLDQIPPMPMPEPNPAPGILPVDMDNSAIFYDAETGYTEILPQQMPSGRIGGQSIEQDYFGVMPFQGDLQNPAGFGTMSVASALESAPRSYNVKLIMRFTDVNGIQRWFACSGSMQDPGVVLTAAHCVYARVPNGITINSFADIVYVYPAWDGDSNNGPFGAPDGDEVIENFGYATGTAFLAGSDYINNGNTDRDAGLIRISRGTSRNIGMLTGWYAWAWGGSCASIQARTYHNFSYPSQNCPTPGLHNGRTMYYWFGSVDACPDNQMQLNTGGGNCLDTVWGGMSGSAMYYIDGDNRYAHSVCSTSNRTTRGYYCKLWEQFTTDMVNFENNTRTSSEDWEPLMMRARGSTTVQAGTAMNDVFDVKMINATNANPAPQDYRLRVYLSSNNNISTGDTLLATWDWNNRDFGAMNNVNFVVPAPFIPIDTAPGTYWIGVIADSGLPGTTTNDDTDTWDAQQITVTVGAPGQASVVSPFNGATNVDENANLDWTAGARATSSTVYFGTDPTPDAGEFLVSTVGSAWNLPPLDWNTTYYWRVDSNNSAGTTTGSVWSFTTEPEPLPDLEATSAVYSAGVYYPGQTINLTHRTTNVGTATSSGVNLDFRASTNNFISTSDTQIGTRNYVGLAPGGNHWVSSNFTLPPTIAPGTYWLGFIATDTDNVDPNSGNDWVAGVETITIVACRPDLNTDGQLDFFDISAFLTAFSNQDPVADWNNDGFFDFFDISGFLQSYSNGCP
ncbi:MAG: hypothetical protein JJ974_00180 [Phycisphaerales bacterium]|nr:hypothetical protein [Phycisphaerales bacterium]